MGFSLGFGVLIFILILGGAFYIYFALALMTMAKKTGIENTWFAWIPILNLILMAKIAQMSPFLLFLLLVPIVNFIIIGMIWWKIAERRGFSGGLGLLMFVPIAQLIMPGVFAWKNTGSEVSSNYPPAISNPAVSNIESVKPMDSFSSEMSSKKNKLFYALLISLAILVISIFLPWVSVSMGFIAITGSGWKLFGTIDILTFLIIGTGILTFFKKRIGAIASLILSILILVYLVLRLVIIPPSIGGGFATIEINLFKYFSFGFYLFLITNIAVGVIAWLFLRKSE